MSNSLSVGNGISSVLQAGGSSVTLRPETYKTIWNRRGGTPTVNKQLNASDQTVARAESKFFLGAAVSLLEKSNSSALTINPTRISHCADEKLYQLHVAQEIGFDIPQTLFSNDPCEIRKFHVDMAGKVIAKQHIPFAWRNTDRTLAVPGTSKVLPAQLKSDLSFSGSPMIYQRYLDISHEIRVTAFGKTAFAISPKRVPAEAGQIRDIRWEEPVATQIDLSDGQREKCFAFMEKLGLVYATFDIAVTKGGDEYFLECNEAGQFLFLEERVPSIPILDAFCRFLASGDKAFSYKKSQSEISVRNFEATPEAVHFRMNSSRSSKTPRPSVHLN